MSLSTKGILGSWEGPGSPAQSLASHSGQAELGSRITRFLPERLAQAAHVDALKD